MRTLLCPTAVVVACALAVAACSGGDPTVSTPTPSETGVTSPSPTPAARPTTAEPTPAPSPTASPTTTPVPEPTDHESADALAADLVPAEQAIRDPATSEAALSAWAHVQQAAYRELYHRPEWRDAVRDAVPAELQPAFDANLFAQTELFALTAPRDELPDWRIVSPPPADELRSHYEAAAAEFGIDWTYLAAIHLVESRMGRIRGASSAGALGPMQFLPATWEAYGEGDVNDPRDAVRAAARYLEDHGAPGDMRGALWAYNHSDHYVDAVEAYARVMQREPEAYGAYYHWRVYYRLASGDVVLDEGWEHPGG